MNRDPKVSEGSTLTRMFGDAAYFVALNNVRDSYHKQAVDLQTRLKKLGYLSNREDLWLSDLVLVEVLQELLKSSGFGLAREVFRLLESDCTIARSNAKDVSIAFYELCSKYHSGPGRGLGIVDAVTVLLTRRNGIGLILSTDATFDRIPALRRIWSHNVDELK